MAKKSAPAKTDWNTWLEQLRAAGFAVSERGENSVLVAKHGCGAILERTPAGQPRFAVNPGLLVDSDVVRLVDGGYQKFWQDQRRRVPALANQLMALHRFDQDLRAVMGLTTLYNEALGTVSARYVYDRLEGREGPKQHHPF
ncbi:MAG: hypothetical protein HY648_07415 [Acidobacteria bacterium]|nr:hypothetical protein [Acidobacteriota bacterium]